ncbi:MAG: cysteine desulfurase [Erysipelotrichaceae bacterium]|nr:cysteine desulfurase [Erysipelotrichaceae bacterium]
MVYLDYAANTPVDEEVLKDFCEATMTYYANPNSFHEPGRIAAKALSQSTNHIAEMLGVLPEEIIYTSGATEANNLAIKGILERYRNRGRHVIIGAFEHNSITSSITAMTRQGFTVDLLSVDQDGLIDINQLKSLLREETILVSICAVDSELGIRQNIEAIGEILKDHRCFYHVDASQAIGKTPIDLTHIDLVTLTPHKFYGLNGTGALIKKKRVYLTPQIDGGRSTTIYRSGTPNTAAIMAFDSALTKALKNMDARYKYVSRFYDDLMDFFKNYDKVHINNTKYSLPYFINISLASVKSQIFAQALESHDIYISTKTSCCPENTPSKLVYALTHSKALASSSLRISLSHLTTDEDIIAFKQGFDASYREVFE